MVQSAWSVTIPLRAVGSAVFLFPVSLQLKPFPMQSITFPCGKNVEVK